MWMPVSPESNRQRQCLPWGWNYNELWILQHSFWETHWCLLQEPYAFLSRIPLASPTTPILVGSPLSPSSLLLLSISHMLSSPSPSFLRFPISLSTSFPFVFFLYHTPFLPLFPPSFECQIFQQLIGNYWIFWMPILRNLFAWSKWKQQKIHVSQYSSAQYIFTILHVFPDGRK